MKIISFYSDTINSNYYSQSAFRLKHDCERLKLDYHIENLQGHSEYKKNCKMKPSFILDCIKKFNQPVVWLDCDSRIVKAPQFLDLERVDYAGVKRGGNDDPVMIASTLYFNTTDSSLKLLEEWSRRCSLEENNDRADHSILLDLIKEELDSNLVFSWLPDSYGGIWNRGMTDNFIRENFTIFTKLAPAREINGKFGTK
jgi:hypothetical protein